MSKPFSKSVYVILIMFLFSFSISAQDYKMGDTDLLITFGPLGILNTDKSSAPSPINFSVGGGAQIRILEFMSVSPQAQFFANYYLWQNDKVLPAEIEHRSAYVPSIMLDIPVSYDLYLSNSVFKFGLSPSFLFRFAFLANNVPDSVQVDIDNINEWFWQSGEFFYPSLQVSWDYLFEDSISVGLGLKAYLPVGSLIKGEGLHNGIASVGVRLGVN